jgi:diguanylate cyclase (GGDEF)-like protein
VGDNVSKNVNGLKLGIGLAALCAILGYSVYQINQNAVAQLLEKDATARSITAARYFEKYLPTGKAILNGTPATPADQAFVAQALDGTGVARFKMFDLQGKFIFDSGQKGLTIGDDVKFGQVNDKALEAQRTGQPHVELEIEHEEDGDKLIAETYVPIIQDDKTIGTAEVYSDQTANAARFNAAFSWSSALIAFLAALGFAAPAAAFYRRNREKIAADESVQFLANHDSLTKLANRASFNERLGLSLNRTLDQGEVATLHFIDLDFFKEINDRHGHGLGDEVLQAVAGRLKQTLRDGDIVARYGGDEFVIAQFGFTKNEQIHAATARIVNVFKEPLTIQGKEISMTASIGSAVAPQHGFNATDLITSADTAVYVVKAGGRNAQCYFEPRFDEAKRKRLALEELVRNAVTTHAFQLNYQPLVRLPSGEIKGFEALLRLRDAEGKFVSPAEFIPVAEEIGLIDQIGTWVMEEACKTAATWPDGMQISVNLSVAQFKHRSIVRSTQQALEKSGIAPKRLLLEITESLLMTETDSILEQLRELKALGVAIVMDDFGTGYSSLGYMLKFPFDRIKIDRSFVSALEQTNQNATNVVQSIIALGHTLKMDVTAEGVETEEQSNALTELKCDDAQGYHFGRPMPATEIPALLLKAFNEKIKSREADKPSTASVAETVESERISA